MARGFTHEPQPGAQETDSWLTPPDLLQKLGNFDMDVCCPPNMPWETAPIMLTEEEDGLKTPWEGRVWCNPPYGKSTGLWLAKCADYGNAMALVFARTETSQFFENVWERAHGILFIRKRITFLRPDGTAPKSSGGAPSCLIAYGRENARCLSALQGELGHYMPNVNRNAVRELIG